MNLSQNIIGNYTFLRGNFTGFNLNFTGIGNFFLHIFIAAGLFVIFYLFGEKLRKLFFNKNKKFNFFVNISLGYIAIGTGIALLGAFSLLQPEIIWAYLIIITLISLYPFRFAPLRKAFLFSLPKKIKNALPAYKDIASWGVFLFILISFLRLMTPEIAEDVYHTDLPRLYLATQTTIHETRDILHVIPYPQLAEMVYLIPIFLGDKETTRFIHFGFYLLIVFLLFAIARNKENSFTKYAPLLFVSAPMMIRYSSTQYVDFFMVFSFLLSIILIEKGFSVKNTILSAIIFGSILSVKLWTLVYMPAVIIYLIIINKNLKINNLIKLVTVFIFSSLSVPLIWYIRSFIITGNPIYPIFSKLEYLEVNNIAAPLSSNYFGINWNMFLPENMVVYSPLFFLGVIFLFLTFNKAIKHIKHFPLSIFFILLMLEQFIVKVDLGRYLLAWYTIAITIVSAGVFFIFEKNKLSRIIFICLFFVIFFYYFINTILILPYGLGWADKNAYLTRVLYRDNASYYDFDRLFNKWISDKDLVATDGIVGFYYADFNYIDIGFIFSKDKRSFDLLKEKKVTRLLIKGGDIEWFCKRLAIKGCSKEKVKLLATYPPDIKKYNLYSIEK
ncbi:hypothetical protein KKF69_06530 [Patescibacteria group bacterium]|nr:hypothetical protein [Patescibacteria group bacterium]